MTQNEMIRNLSEKCNVTLEEAGAALKVGEGNMLTAAQYLENEKLRKAQEIEEAVSSCEAGTDQSDADEQAATTANAEGAEPAEAGKRCGSKALKDLGGHIRRLVACGNRNRFVVRRNDATLLKLPVTVMVVLMLFAFWTCLPLMVIGLFLGCRYSFSGQDLGRKSINNALDKAADAAERVKGSVARA